MTFTLNEETVPIDVDLTMRLLDYLREYRGLMGTKEGCGEGECGACAVLIDGVNVNACLVPMGNVIGKTVVTIEGLSGTDGFSVLQKAFEEAGAIQCGFCTPGMMIAATSLLKGNPNPSEAQIRVGISGNLCRCSGYNMIVKAIQKAAEGGDGLW